MLPGAAVPPVVARLGEVVRAGTHLDVLLEVSALLDEVERDGPELDSRWLVSALVEHENVVTTTALAILARLLGDEILQARVRRELRLREDPVPGWLTDLDRLAGLVSVACFGLAISFFPQIAAGEEVSAVLHYSHA